MATYSRRLLSGSTSGKPIKVTGTATGASVTVHTAISGADVFDEVYIYASNNSNATATLTVEWGGTTDPDDLMAKAYSIPANTPAVPSATGQVLNGGLVIKAFAGTANVICLTGFVNRIQ
jgi:hypothetical protein